MCSPAKMSRARRAERRWPVLVMTWSPHPRFQAWHQLFQHLPSPFVPSDTHLTKVNDGWWDPQWLCDCVNDAVESYDVPLHNHRVIDTLGILQRRTEMMSPDQKASPLFPVSKEMWQTLGGFLTSAEVKPTECSVLLPAGRSDTWRSYPDCDGMMVPVVRLKLKRTILLDDTWSFSSSPVSV